MTRADPDLTLNSMVLETLEYVDATLDLPGVMGVDANPEFLSHLHQARSNLLQALAVCTADAVATDGQAKVEVPEEWMRGGY